MVLVVITASGSSVFKCPFCPCVFCSEHDLLLHLKAFGDAPHLLEWERQHRDLELEPSRLHGGADRAVGQLAHVVNPYVVIAPEDYEFLKKRFRKKRFRKVR
jgi:hypothetical protein